MDFDALFFCIAAIAAIADIGGSKNWWEVSGPTSHIYTYYIILLRYTYDVYNMI